MTARIGRRIAQPKKIERVVANTPALDVSLPASWQEQVSERLQRCRSTDNVNFGTDGARYHGRPRSLSAHILIYCPSFQSREGAKRIDSSFDRFERGPGFTARRAPCPTFTNTKSGTQRIKQIMCYKIPNRSRAMARTELNRTVSKAAAASTPCACTRSRSRSHNL